MGSDPFLGQLTGFGGNFAPRGWAFCSGALLQVSQNDALFSLLGTIYGGDGRTTFGLPDLRGRAPIGQGTGAGLNTYVQGQQGGVENVTLTVGQLPVHNHTHQAITSNENLTPENNILDNSNTKFSSSAPGTLMNNGVVGSNGGNQSHYNIPPYQCINWIIALVGVYPSRS